MQRLIDLITKEVMKRLEGIEKNTEIKKNKVLLLDSASCGCLDDAREALAEKYDVDSLDNMNCKIEEYEACIVCRVGNRQLASIAHGLCSSSMEEMIMKFLLIGKSVYMLEDGIEYRRYLDTANTSLLKLYQGYERKIVEYGVKLIKSFKDILGANEIKEPIKAEVVEKKEKEEIQHTHQVEECVNVNFIDLTGKKLITEADLRKLCRTGINEVLISRKSVITPLAQDFIRINRLGVKRA